MSAVILPFAASAHKPRVVPPDTPPPAFYVRPRTYRVADLARMLSLSGQPRTVIAALRRLADDSGLPLPRNPRYHAGELQRGAMAIGSRSIWDAGAIEYWLDGLPPAPAAAAPARRYSANDALRGQMSARAAQLAQGAAMGVAQ